MDAERGSAMKEITVKELMEMTGGDIRQVESVDRYGIYIRMEQANLIYDGDKDGLTFQSRAASEVSLNVGSSIEYISVGEDGTVMIEFDPKVSVIEIRRAGESASVYLK